jgi:hypothetical protein
MGKMFPCNSIPLRTPCAPFQINLIPENQLNITIDGVKKKSAHSNTFLPLHHPLSVFIEVGANLMDRWHPRYSSGTTLLPLQNPLPNDLHRVCDSRTCETPAVQLFEVTFSTRSKSVSDAERNSAHLVITECLVMAGETLG